MRGDLVRLGMELVCSRRDKEGSADLLARLVGQAQLAERLGYDVVWFPEHHDTDWNIITDPFLVLAHLAAATSAIGLGTSVINLGLHHPLEVAERAAMVNALSRGRLHLGLGRGLSPLDYSGYGLDAEGSRERFERHYQVLADRLASSAETASIPVWISTSGAERTIDLACEHGHHLMVNPDGDVLTRIVGRVRDRNAGTEVALARLVHVADDESAAWDEFTPWLRWFHRQLALREIRLPDIDRYRAQCVTSEAGACAQTIEGMRARYGFDDFIAVIGISGMSWPLFERTARAVAHAARPGCLMWLGYGSLCRVRCRRWSPAEQPGARNPWPRDAGTDGWLCAGLSRCAHPTSDGIQDILSWTAPRDRPRPRAGTLT